MINGCDAGYPPEVEEDQPEEPDVELPTVWYGPQQYAEDFYSGGTVPTGARDASRIGETDEYEGDSEEPRAEEDEKEEDGKSFITVYQEVFS